MLKYVKKMNKRNSKHYTLDINKNFNIKYCTYNKKNPDVIHISGKTWLQPINGNIKEINGDICGINKNVISKLINDKYFINNNFIFDIDYANTQLSKDKKSFLTFDLFIKQKETSKINDAINNEISLLSTKIVDNIVNSVNNNAIFYKQKIDFN